MLILWVTSLSEEDVVDVNIVGYEFMSEEDVVDVNIVDYEFVRRGCCRC